MPLRVFLCHASEDKPKVRELYTDLKEAGFTPWFDEIDLLGGQDWDRAIQDAVKDSDVIVVCLSDRSVEKTGYVQKEIKLALDAADQQPEGRIYIIPVRLCDCEIPQRIARWQAIDLFAADGYGRLERSLVRRVIVDGLWQAAPTEDSDQVADIDLLNTIRSKALGLIYPFTHEVAMEFSQSVEQLENEKTDQTIHSICVASRVALLHATEMVTLHRDDADDFLHKLDKLFDRATPHLKDLSSIKHPPTKAYAHQVCLRAQRVKEIRRKLPPPRRRTKR